MTVTTRLEASTKRKKTKTCSAVCFLLFFFCFNRGRAGYQMPLDRPPGGARIRAEDLFGMWSSIWAPGQIRYAVMWFYWHSEQVCCTYVYEIQ